MTQELEVYDAEPVAQPLNLFGVAEPEQVVERAASVAAALADVVRKQKLTSRISGREHVRVEGWTLLGSMLGVFPVCEWTRKLDDGWEARVVVRTRDGALIGAAEAECLRSEKTWASRDDYALRSMAQTRATSKALRQPLGFVMTLAGLDPTPAEEMPRDESPRQPSKSKVEKMRARIGALAADADKKREAEPGTTMAEVEDSAVASFGVTFSDLAEESLAALGSDLKEWLAQGCPVEPFRLIPF